MSTTLVSNMTLRNFNQPALLMLALLNYYQLSYYPLNLCSILLSIMSNFSIWNPFCSSY